MNPLHELFELGLSPELYQRELTFWKLGVGELLHGNPACGSVPTLSQSPKKRIRNLAEARYLCDCWIEALEKDPDPQSTLAHYEYHHALLLRQEEKRNLHQPWSERPGLALGALRAYWALLQARMDKHDALQTWYGRTLNEVAGLIGHIEQHCRTPEMQDDLSCRWENAFWHHVSSERTLILAPIFWLDERNSDLATALITWGVGYREDKIFLDGPAWLVRAVREAGGSTDAHVPLQENDTPAIIETAVALWSTDKEDVLHNLEAALETARNL